MSFESLINASIRNAAIENAVSTVGVPVSKSIDQEEMLLEAITSALNTNIRSMGMSAIIEWANNGDASFSELEAIAAGLADVDEDGEVSEEEEESFNEILFASSQALAKLGVKQSVIDGLLNDSDDSAESALDSVEKYLEDTAETDAEIIASFAVANEMMTEAKKKVIRDGEVVWVNKPLRKRRMTAKQKAALKRARAKANTGLAKAKRAKAMKMRKSRGM